MPDDDEFPSVCGCWRRPARLLDSSTGLSKPQLYPLQAMLYQIEQIKEALSGDDPWQSLIVAHPQLDTVARTVAGLTGGTGTQEAIVGLYRRYCDEWRLFPMRPPSCRTEHVA